jgi:regulator of telomere elongation helicase 1
LTESNTDAGSEANDFYVFLFDEEEK